ncbi:hypothetical protein HRI_001627200 [Hibiscus trionum]|uniref:Reverse transcriptase zinc-binding domain-containing protein n=1 Tax=Hibiscus trionum TaxID=183268 RepID=A0A9W7LWD3_HIBTR|nr:hypothetical protein HRI_001627200 [Hibiscus trionum]
MTDGELGIRDLNLQNRALLGKWIWKFSNERDILWKKAICSKYNLDSTSLYPVLSNSPLNSWIWKGIVNSFAYNDTMGFALQDNLCIHVRDGKSILFWSDVWISEAPLQIIFLRVFALSINKSGKVLDFGSKINLSWVWNIVLRRRLFDWEVER